MNPPLDHGVDIKHIERAATMLCPGGRLVAVCANGPLQRNRLMPLTARNGGSWHDLAEGAVVLPLALAAERLPEVVEKHLGSLVDSNSPFSARNDAHWTDGALVYVPRNTIVEDPIVITNTHEQAGTALHWRTLVVL